MFLLGAKCSHHFLQELITMSPPSTLTKEREGLQKNPEPEAQQHHCFTDETTQLIIVWKSLFGEPKCQSEGPEPSWRWLSSPLIPARLCIPVTAEDP